MTADKQSIHELVSKVVYNRGYDGLDGLDPLRRLLWKDEDGTVAGWLELELGVAPEKVRGGIAYLLGARYLELGRLDLIQTLVTSADAEVQASALGSLTGDTRSHSDLGNGIVALAIAGTATGSPAVRAAACSVLMNQCAWGVDVTDAVNPLFALLEDADAAVRQSAAYAVGHFAKGKRYELTAHIAMLGRLLRDENGGPGTAAAWALWKLAGKRDIVCAIPALVSVLEQSAANSAIQKYAIGALLACAKKSVESRDQIQALVASVGIDMHRKDMVRFLQQLGEIV